MALLSQQTKDGLIVAVTIGVGVATGLLVDDWSKHESIALALSSVVVLGVIQLALTMAPSKDMADLEEYRKAETAQLRIKNAMTAQAITAVEEGRLSDAIEWRSASDSIPSGGKINEQQGIPDTKRK